MQKKKAVEFDKFYYFSKVIVLIIILLSHHICVMFKPWSLFVVFCSKLSYLGYSFYYYYYDFNFLFVIKSAKGFSFLDLVITVSRQKYIFKIYDFFFSFQLFNVYIIFSVTYRQPLFNHLKYQQFSCLLLEENSTDFLGVNQL